MSIIEIAGQGGNIKVERFVLLSTPTRTIYRMCPIGRSTFRTTYHDRTPSNHRWQSDPHVAHRVGWLTCCMISALCGDRLTHSVGMCTRKQERTTRLASVFFFFDSFSHRREVSAFLPSRCQNTEGLMIDDPDLPLRVDFFLLWIGGTMKTLRPRRRDYVRWHVLQQMYLLWRESHKHIVRKMRGVVQYPKLKKRVAECVQLPTYKTVNCEVRWLIENNYITTTNQKRQNDIWNIYLTDEGLELAWLAYISDPTDDFREHAEAEYNAGKCRVVRKSFRGESLRNRI